MAGFAQGFEGGFSTVDNFLTNVEVRKLQAKRADLAQQRESAYERNANQLHDLRQTQAENAAADRNYQLAERHRAALASEVEALSTDSNGQPRSAEAIAQDPRMIQILNDPAFAPIRNRATGHAVTITKGVALPNGKLAYEASWQDPKTDATVSHGPVTVNGTNQSDDPVAQFDAKELLAGVQNYLAQAPGYNDFEAKLGHQRAYGQASRQAFDAARSLSAPSTSPVALSPSRQAPSPESVALSATPPSPSRQAPSAKPQRLTRIAELINARDALSAQANEYAHPVIGRLQRETGQLGPTPQAAEKLRLAKERAAGIDAELAKLGVKHPEAVQPLVTEYAELSAQYQAARGAGEKGLNPNSDQALSAQANANLLKKRLAAVETKLRAAGVLPKEAPAPAPAPETAPDVQEVAAQVETTPPVTTHEQAQDTADQLNSVKPGKRISDKQLEAFYKLHQLAPQAMPLDRLLEIARTRRLSKSQMKFTPIGQGAVIAQDGEGNYRLIQAAGGSPASTAAGRIKVQKGLLDVRKKQHELLTQAATTFANADDPKYAKQEVGDFVGLVEDTPYLPLLGIDKTNPDHQRVLWNAYKDLKRGEHAANGGIIHSVATTLGLSEDKHFHTLTPFIIGKLQGMNPKTTGPILLTLSKVSGVKDPQILAGGVAAVGRIHQEHPEKSLDEIAVAVAHNLSKGAT